MSKIKSIRAMEILDSRGNPTLRVRLESERGAVGIACVPSGASTGEFEAHELRDGGERYGGLGVLQACKNVAGELADMLCGRFDVCDQFGIDRAIRQLDGSENKSRLGANALLGVSLAAAHAGAAEYGMPLYRYIGGASARLLPMPMMNILNGGSHADNSVDFQEFMVMPIGAQSFSEAVRCGTEIFHALKAELKQDDLSTAVGDEGGFAPNLQSNEQALEYVLRAIERAGYRAGSEVQIALDVAASELYDPQSGQYRLTGEGVSLSPAQLIARYRQLCERYPIASIEDGLEQNDFENTALLTRELPGVQIVGDDLFVTNTKRLKLGIESRAANCILIKPNQIGTLSETIEAVELARREGYRTIMSHRSGETEDSTIADLAVALATGQIKTGSLSRSERCAKYNRLLVIERDLCQTSVFNSAR